MARLMIALRSETLSYRVDSLKRINVMLNAELCDASEPARIIQGVDLLRNLVGKHAASHARALHFGPDALKFKLRVVNNNVLDLGDILLERHELTNPSQANVPGKRRERYWGLSPACAPHAPHRSWTEQRAPNQS